MNNEIKLKKFSGPSFSNFFDFMISPVLICFGDKFRNSDKGVVISSLDVCFFTNYIKGSFELPISIFWHHSREKISRIDSTFDIRDINPEKVEINMDSISLEDLILDISYLSNQFVLIDFQDLSICNVDKIHGLFKKLKNISQSNSLYILVFGLGYEFDEWNISLEYADVNLYYELEIKESLLQTELFNPPPRDGIYKLSIKKNRYGETNKSIILGKVLRKGYYLIEDNYLEYAIKTKTTNRISSNRYLDVETLCPKVLDNNEIVAYMGYFGFNLNGLFEYSKHKFLTTVSVENFVVYDSSIYEDQDMKEPIIILEVNPDFVNKGENFNFWSKYNFYIISGQKKFLKEKDKNKEKQIDVFLFTMEEILPYIIEHRSNFVDYWNDKLDNYLDTVE